MMIKKIIEEQRIIKWKNGQEGTFKLVFEVPCPPSAEKEEFDQAAEELFRPLAKNLLTLIELAHHNGEAMKKRFELMDFYLTEAFCEMRQQ
jgi:hypothetical protein